MGFRTPKSQQSIVEQTASKYGRIAYGIKIVEIAVAETKLHIPSTIFTNAKAVIDSWTVFTRQPPMACNALRTAVQNKMASCRRAKSFAFLVTCYGFSNKKSAVVPKIRFTISGGTFMDLDPSSMFYTTSNSQVCLAFVPSKDDTDIIIYGNVQQRTFEVIYDVARGQLGFAPNGCS